MINDSCDKIPFDSEKEAKKEIHRMKNRGVFSKGKKEQKTPSRAYKCDKCGFWHMTRKK